MVLFRIRVGLSVSDNLINATSHGFTKSSVPMVILNPIKLRIQINPPVFAFLKAPCVLAWPGITSMHCPGEMVAHALYCFQDKGQRVVGGRAGQSFGVGEILCVCFNLSGLGSESRE